MRTLEFLDHDSSAAFHFYPHKTIAPGAAIL